MPHLDFNGEKRRPSMAALNIEKYLSGEKNEK